MRIDMVLAYVRDLMGELSGERPEPDESGQVSIQGSLTRIHVQVVSPQDPVVRVFAVAATEVAASAELLAELNERNAKVRFARVWLADGRLVVETEIWAVDLDPSNFGFACNHIADVAAELADRAVKEFDGKPVPAAGERDAGAGSGSPNAESGSADAEPEGEPAIGDPTPSEFTGSQAAVGRELPGMYL